MEQSARCAVFAVLLSWLVLSGCDSASDDGQRGDGGADGAAPAMPLETRTVTVTGHINGGGIISQDASGIEVCVEGRDDVACVETEPQGQYAIEVPRRSEVALAFRGPGLTPTLRAFLTGDEPLELGNTRVADSVGLSTVAAALGYDDDPERGAVFFAGIEGVIVELADVEGGGDVFFLDLRGTVVADAVELPVRGTGGFVNVEPGNARLRFSRGGAACDFREDNTLSGWPDDEGGVAVAPILPGHHTHIITMFCGDP